MMTGGLGVGGFLTNIFTMPIASQGVGALRPRRVYPNVAAGINPLSIFSPKTPAVTHLSAGENELPLDACPTSPAPSPSPRFNADACIGIKAHQPYIAGLHGAAMKLVNRRGLSLVAHG